MSKDQVLTVSALSSYIEEKFVRDPYLERVFIKGEISNSKLHSSGIFYFTLKDTHATIRGIMFSNKVRKLKKLPEEGDGVIIEGAITVFKSGGYYQITANDIELDGQGQLYEKLEKNKKMLEEKGYFKHEYKKALPKFPKEVILITSKTSAAYKDMINAVTKRFPLTKVKVLNTLMQGQKSIDSVIKNLEIADNSQADVIILSRGGGSIEDLWTFNELEVAKKVFHMTTPTITAIGHETDTTLVDYVSDKRATTPTQAIELALIDQYYLLEKIAEDELRLKKLMRDKLIQKETQLESYKNYYKFRMPSRLYDQHIQKLVYKKDQLNALYNTHFNNYQNKYNELNYELKLLTPKNKIHKYRNTNNDFKKTLTNEMNLIFLDSKSKVRHKLEVLNRLNPLEILKRGYSFTSLDDHVLKSVKDVKQGDALTIHVSDGRIKTKVTEVIDDE